MIELRGVCKRYGARPAVEAVDLTIPRGRITVLIGPSGCGKSTLLRLINGLVIPDRGTVRFDGQPLRNETVLATRRRTGYVIQGGGLFPHLVARDNVTLMARWLGWSQERIGRRLEDLLELMRLDPRLLGRYPRQLSGGQRQRIALMRALMLEPAVLLLDEPLAALDPMTRVGLQDELREIFVRVGATVVLVTHDLSEAEYFADRVVLLRQGRIVTQGPPDAVFVDPPAGFVRDFVSAQRPRRWMPGAADGA